MDFSMAQHARQRSYLGNRRTLQAFRLLNPSCTLFVWILMFIRGGTAIMTQFWYISKNLGEYFAIAKGSVSLLQLLEILDSLECPYSKQNLIGESI